MQERRIVYNTEDEAMVISEYGRNIQKMVGQLIDVKDRIHRNQLAEGIVQVMISLNPQVKEITSRNFGTIFLLLVILSWM